MKKQYMLIALVISFSTSAWAQYRSKQSSQDNPDITFALLPQDEQSDQKHIDAKREGARVLQAAADKKQVLEAFPIIHTEIRRMRMPDGTWKEVITGYTNEKACEANKKIDDDIKVLREKITRIQGKIVAEQNAFKRSTGLLVFVLLSCMYIHNKGLLEVIAELYGPISAHAIHVFATIALGSSANRMWSAGGNAWSKLPQTIKEYDKKIKDKALEKVDQSVYEKLTTRETTYDFPPRDWGFVPSALSAASEIDPIGMGLGLSGSCPTGPAVASSTDVSGKQASEEAAVQE